MVLCLVFAAAAQAGAQRGAGSELSRDEFAAMLVEAGGLLIPGGAFCAAVW